MRILVLGGYGLIGSSILNHLHQKGYDVVGLGRSLSKGKMANPEISWLTTDISKLTQAEDWFPIIENIDVVVNAAGALQNGLKDSVYRLQFDAMLALYKACEIKKVEKFVQISAPGAAPQSNTDFYASKGVADEALKSSALNYIIFRPGLVISPRAYGGTSLVRMLSAFPIIQPIALPESHIQIVDAEDVARAVSIALERGIIGDFDLVASEAETLKSIILKFRNWLGFTPPKVILNIPSILTNLTTKFADLSGVFGWRSPLRSDAIKVLSDDVKGNGEEWGKVSGQKLISLDQTLAKIPSSIQERIFAQSALVFPIALIMYSLFWICSGIIGLIQFDAAKAVFVHTTPELIKSVSVGLGSIVDILIGLGLLVRPLARKTALTSIFVSVSYLVGSLFYAPALWADPLGPMIKVFPAICLALFLAVMAEER